MAFALMQGAVESIVDGLFSALVTLGTVPIIKCPKVRQGLAAMCELILFLVFSAMCKYIRDISNYSQAIFSCMYVTKSLVLILVCTPRTVTNAALPQSEQCMRSTSCWPVAVWQSVHSHSWLYRARDCAGRFQLGGSSSSR